MIVKVVLGLSGSARFVLFWKRGLRTYPQVQKEVDEIFGDPPLGDEVHHGKEQERLVRCSMVGYLRVLVSAPVGPEVSEHLEVFLMRQQAQHERSP